MSLRFGLIAALLCAICTSGACSVADAAQKAQAAPEVRKLQAGGVGLQVVPIATGEIVVIAVLPDSPADRAKILPGDLIVAVDGTALRGRNFTEVAKGYLWGRAGSKVKVTWLRPGVKGKASAQLVRTVLKDDPAQNLDVKMLVPVETNGKEAPKP